MEEIKNNKEKKTYKRFMLSPKNNNKLMLTGCFTGLGKYLGIDSLILKVAFILFSFYYSFLLSGLLYLALYYFTPKYNPEDDLSLINNIKQKNSIQEEDTIVIKKTNKVVKEKE
jgi:phage shock protein PspC (stress-responsive transcriptional regulator)